MAIACFSIAIAVFGVVALGAIEAGAALGLFSFLGLRLSKRALTGA